MDSNKIITDLDTQRNLMLFNKNSTRFNEDNSVNSANNTNNTINPVIPINNKSGIKSKTERITNVTNASFEKENM